MAITIKHAKTDTIADWTQADLDQQIAAGNYPPGTTLANIVLPSDWNNDHTVVGAATSGANSDITSLSGITGSITSPTYVGFNTSYATALGVGQLGWDNTNNALAYGMANGNIIQHIGEDQYLYVKASSAITKGQVCMFTGSVGASGVLTAAPATGITDGTYIMGVAAESIANNGFGFVQTFGVITGVNTTGFADGDILWYNPSVAGGLTNTKPSAPNVKVQVAACNKGGSAGGGVITVRINAGSSLGGTDNNVQITSPTTGQSLVYNSGTTIWTNSNAVVMNGGSVDNSPIGATTASTGAFTTVTATTSGTFGTSTSAVTPLTISSGAGANNTRGIAFNIASTAFPYARINVPSGSGGALSFFASDGTYEPVEQARIARTVSAVNYVQVTGAATGSGPLIYAQGSDASVNLNLSPKAGGQVVFLQNGASTPKMLTLTAVGSSVNYFDISPAATGTSPKFVSTGSDTNISMAFQPKGTGAIDLAAGSSGVNISNGGTVTAITRTAAGSGYTSVPSVAITAPTTAGGVQATATAQVVINSVVSITSGGTGYTVGDVLTIVGGTAPSQTTQLTVSTVSTGVITGVTITRYGTYTATPTNPATVTGGTGSGATFTLDYAVQTGTFTITNAGSGYIEQPTVTFSGGGGSGASAYATVGSATVLKSLANMGVFTAGGQQFGILDSAATSTAYWQAIGGAGTADLRTNSGSTTGAYISNGAASAINFRTNINASPATQAVIAHTASAVNYVQVTGAATGGTTTISAQGSDTNVNLAVNAKGTGAVQINKQLANYYNMYGSAAGTGAVTMQAVGSDTNIIFNIDSGGTQSIRFRTNGGSQEEVRINHVASAVNRIDLFGSITGAAPSFAVNGSDTNIDLALTPKGTGRVKFGTYTASVLTPTGYIEVLDSGGTLRRLLVG